MKDKVTGVHISFTDYKSEHIRSLGQVYFFRETKEATDKDRISSNTSIRVHRVARALEAQRLFLAQLEKKAGKV